MIIEYIDELNEYDAYNKLWAGGLDTIKDLSVNEVAEVLCMIDEIYDKPTITEINDFFWFERDTIAELLGFNDYEEIMERDMEV